MVYSSSAISITGNVQRINFEPNLEKSYSYSVGGEKNISASLIGGLSKYATLIDPNPRGGPRSVKINLKLPKSLPKPGKWQLLLRASQINPNTGGISTKVIMRIPIVVYVPYKGVYLVGGLKINKIEINQTGIIELKLTNKGVEDSNALHISLNVYDENNKTMQSFDKNYVNTIKSTKSFSYFFNFSTKGWEPGLYPVSCNITYLNKSLHLKGKLTIGDMDAYLNQIKPDYLWLDEINKVTLIVGANWKSPRPVFGKVYLDGKKMEKTATEEIGNFQTAAYTVFVDTHGFELGKHNFGVRLYYNGKEKYESRSVLVKEHINKEVAEEKPESNRKLVIFSVLAITVVLVAVFLLFYYFYKR